MTAHTDGPCLLPDRRLDMSSGTILRTRRIEQVRVRLHLEDFGLAKFSYR